LLAGYENLAALFLHYREKNKAEVVLHSAEHWIVVR
jgi:hypothetical protein